jgi:hypothetical protein
MIGFHMRKIALALLLAGIFSPAMAQTPNTIHNQSTVTLPVAVGDELAIWDPTKTLPLGQYKATVQQLFNIAGIGGDCTGSGGPVVSIVCSLAATKITSGTLAAARLPLPTSSSVGGVQSVTPVTHQFMTSISTGGVGALAQPSVADLSDGNHQLSGQDVGNAIRNGTSPATPTACGTSPTMAAGSTDFGGTVNVGSGTVTACTVAFAVTHATVLRCWVQPSSGVPVVPATTMSTTAMVVTFSASLGSGRFDYGCH